MSEFIKEAEVTKAIILILGGIADVKNNPRAILTFYLHIAFYLLRDLDKNENNLVNGKVEISKKGQEFGVGLMQMSRGCLEIATGIVAAIASGGLTAALSVALVVDGVRTAGKGAEKMKPLIMAILQYFESNKNQEVYGESLGAYCKIISCWYQQEIEILEEYLARSYSKKNFYLAAEILILVQYFYALGKEEVRHKTDEIYRYYFKKKYEIQQKQEQKQEEKQEQEINEAFALISFSLFPPSDLSKPEPEPGPLRTPNIKKEMLDRVKLWKEKRTNASDNKAEPKNFDNNNDSPRSNMGDQKDSSFGKYTSVFRSGEKQSSCDYESYKEDGDRPDETSDFMPRYESKSEDKQSLSDHKSCKEGSDCFDETFYELKSEDKQSSLDHKSCKK